MGSFSNMFGFLKDSFQSEDKRREKLGQQIQMVRDNMPVIDGAKYSNTFADTDSHSIIVSFLDEDQTSETWPAVEKRISQMAHHVGIPVLKTECIFAEDMIQDMRLIKLALPPATHLEESLKKLDAAVREAQYNGASVRENYAKNSEPS